MTTPALDAGTAEGPAVPARPHRPVLSRVRASLLIERLCVDALRRVARRRMH